jgi:hypothetical protein
VSELATGETVLKKTATVLPTSQGRYGGERHDCTYRQLEGGRFQLSVCTTEELPNLAANAQQTHDQIHRFVESIEAKLARRRATKQNQVA